MKRMLIILVTLVSCAPASVDAKPPLKGETSKNPVELGDVSWGRDLVAAQKASKASGKPVFILFDEVPGCSTVIGFGKSVLRDPLVVEAIETEFEPVVVYNNVSGKDRKILKSYGEPTWNNPVVRIFNAKNKELTERFAGPYDSATLVAHMVDALNKANRTVPKYLSEYHAQLTAPTQKAVFGMYCFWTGESKFAQIDGVVSTRAGFMSGHEVVEVTYDTSKIAYGALVKKAKSLGAADTAFVTNDVHAKTAAEMLEVKRQSTPMRFSEKDDKYFLRRSPYKSLVLTDYQQTKVNAAVARKEDATRFLSERQRSLLESARKR